MPGCSGLNVGFTSVKCTQVHQSAIVINVRDRGQKPDVRCDSHVAFVICLHELGGEEVLLESAE